MNKHDTVRKSEPPTASRRRFRLEKLEERIAPAGHYNPQSKWVGGSSPGGGGGSGTSSGLSGDSYTTIF
jgi:hypothetical protein